MRNSQAARLVLLPETEETQEREVGATMASASRRWRWTQLHMHQCRSHCRTIFTCCGPRSTRLPRRLFADGSFHSSDFAVRGFWLTTDNRHDGKVKMPTSKNRDGRGKIARVAVARLWKGESFTPWPHFNLKSHPAVGTGCDWPAFINSTRRPAVPRSSSMRNRQTLELWWRQPGLKKTSFKEKKFWEESPA